MINVNEMIKDTKYIPLISTLLQVTDRIVKDKIIYESKSIKKELVRALQLSLT